MKSDVSGLSIRTKKHTIIVSGKIEKIMHNIITARNLGIGISPSFFSSSSCEIDSAISTLFF